MNAIEAWLDLEEAAYQRAEAAWERSGCEGEMPVRGFRCNWDSTRRRWVDGTTTVHVLIVDGEPVGFLDGKDILESEGQRLRDGSVQLDNRAACFDPTHEGHHDYFVSICADGRQLLFGKVKFDESRAVGVGHDAGDVYFVKRVLMPDDLPET